MSLDEEDEEEKTSDYEGGDNAGDNADGKVGHPIDEKEPSRRRLNSLKAMMKRILFETKDTDIKARILGAWTNSDGLTQNELTTIADLCPALKQFIPPKTAKDITAFCLPLVILSNTVQRVAGYQKWKLQAQVHLEKKP